MSAELGESSVSRPTIVVFGGSFDPPHISHAMAALFALSTLPEAHLWVIPTYEHPLGKTFGASYRDRLEMCRRAMHDLPRTVVSGLEGELGGTSRTLDTLRELQSRFPGSELRLLIGADILTERERWHRFDEVVRLAPLMLVGRPGFDSEAPFTLPDVSSRSLRAELASGHTPEGRVARRVLDWIEQKNLYREHGADNG